MNILVSNTRGTPSNTDESTAPGRVPEQGLVPHVLETLPLLETWLGMGMDRVAVVDLVGGNQLDRLRELHVGH